MLHSLQGIHQTVDRRAPPPGNPLKMPSLLGEGEEPPVVYRNDVPRALDASAMLLRATEKREIAEQVRFLSRTLPEERRRLFEGHATELDQEAAELERKAEQLTRQRSGTGRRFGLSHHQ